MHVLGNDFAFENAHMNFMNWDKMINYINSN